MNSAGPLQAIQGAQATDGLTVGMAPSVAMGMTYGAMADSIAMVMQNAAVTQRSMQLIATAATARVCVLIIQKGASG